MADADEKAVYIFLDVDGVLNDKWIGHAEPSPATGDKAESLHPTLVDNLANLVSRLQTEQSLDPKLVLSTTWRLQQQSCAELLSSLTKVKVGGEKTLEQYLLRSVDCKNGDANDMSSWATPDLGHGTTPEGRVAEIQAWLIGHCRRTNNGTTRKRGDLLFLILDDLDLLYTDSGKRNEGVRPQNFVCTASYQSHSQVDGEVGLTPERVELALQKVRQQAGTRRTRRYGTGTWTEGEWAVLSASPGLQPHLQALRSDECPSWIAEIARRHIKNTPTQKKKKKGRPWWKQSQGRR